MKQIKRKYHGSFKSQVTTILVIVTLFITAPVFAQEKSNPPTDGNEILNQMYHYSRPVKYHQMLEDLVGSWAFKGSRFEWVDSVTSKVSMELCGSLVRRSFADGRFFIAEMTTCEKVQLPVRGGLIKDYGRAVQTEGYDNVKKKFQVSYINNHIGSTL